MPGLQCIVSSHRIAYDVIASFDDYKQMNKLYGVREYDPPCEGPGFLVSREPIPQLL